MLGVADVLDPGSGGRDAAAIDPAAVVARPAEGQQFAEGHRLEQGQDLAECDGLHRGPGRRRRPARPPPKPGRGSREVAPAAGLAAGC